MAYGAAAPRGDDASPTLKRILISEDGRLKAQFEDNTLLLVNGAGSAFIHCAPGSNGTKSRQLSEYALSRYAASLCAALEFRNLHADAPYYCKALLAATPAAQTFTVGYIISSVLWPASLKEAYDRGLITHMASGQIAVQSNDATARIVVAEHSTPLRFAVCYPLLVTDDPARGSYTYVWQTQSFPVQSYPERWQPAVALALAAARLARPAGASASQAHANSSENDGVTSEPSFSGAATGWEVAPVGDADGGDHPSAQAAAAQPLFGSIPERTTALPRATSRLHDAGKPRLGRDDV